MNIHRYITIARTARIALPIASALPIALLALASCTAADGDLPTGQTLPPGAVRITATIDAQPATRATLAPDGSGTFAPGDVWGMYTRLADGTGTAINNNLAFAYGTTILYWDELSAAAPVTFSAHYPRRTDAGEGTNTPTAYPFTLGSSPADSDLLFATATAAPDEDVALDFRHLMHRLVVNLRADAALGNVDLSAATISILPNGTTKSTVSVNLLNGETDYATATGRMDGTPTTGPTSDRILVPQDLTPGAEWIEIALNGDTYIYKVPATLKPAATTTPPDPHPTRLESGRRLTLNLTLKPGNKVVLTSSGISGWGDQGSSTDGELNLADGVTVVSTFDELKAAIAAVPDGEGSADAPAATIRLGADITVPHDETLLIGDINGTTYKHIRIDGDGYTLKRGGSSALVMLGINLYSSLTLTDITVDGDGKDGRLLLVDGDATLILGNGATVTNVGSGGTCVIMGGGSLRMKPGSAITKAGGYAIKANALFFTVFFEGGTLKDNGTDVRMAVDGNAAPLKVQVWPKMNGGSREKLTIETLDRTRNPSPYSVPCFVAEGVAPLAPALAAADFDLVKALYYDGTADFKDFDHTTLELYKDPADGIIKLRRRNPVSTLAELKAAIAAVPDGAGSVDNPTIITLTADILMGDNDNLAIGADGGTPTKHIRIDGGGKYTIRSGTNYTIMTVYTGSSLTLTDITVDGDGATPDGMLTVKRGGTLILGDGATVTNVNTNSPNSCCIRVEDGGLLRLKPGSAVTNAKATSGQKEGAAIYTEASVDATTAVSFEGGTLEGNGTDVWVGVVGVGGTAIPLSVQVWPKMKADGSRDKLTIETVASHENIYSDTPLIAKAVAPLTLEPTDFSLLKAWTGGGGTFDHTTLELYKDGNTIKLRMKTNP